MLIVRIVRRVARLLARRDADAAVDDEVDELAQAQAEAVQLPMPLSDPRSQSIKTSSRHRTAVVDGFSLHANTSVDADDRAALERLTRYMLRPMITANRLTERADGRVEYVFPPARSDGSYLAGHRRSHLVSPACHADPAPQKPYAPGSRRVVLCTSMARTHRAHAPSHRGARLAADLDDPRSPAGLGLSPAPGFRRRRHPLPAVWRSPPRARGPHSPDVTVRILDHLGLGSTVSSSTLDPDFPASTNPATNGGLRTPLVFHHFIGVPAHRPCTATTRRRSGRATALKAPRLETLHRTSYPRPLVLRRSRGAARAVVTAGRNDPCPRGSGKKYKRCCQS